LAVVLTGASLVLVAWAIVLAQQPRSVPSPSAKNPVSPPPTRSNYRESVPINPYASIDGGSYAPLSPPSLGGDVSLLPVKVELRKGLVLDGQLPVTGPLACATAFGEAALPLAAIRGIRLHEVQEVANAERVGPQATIILSNNDSLTVYLRAAQFQVKTEWGEANIGVAHLRSILLTADDVEWQEAGGRWSLVAEAKSEPEPVDEVKETTVLPSTRNDANTIPSLNPTANPLPVPAELPPALPELPTVPKSTES
jgi:hypothetical protein